MNAIERGTWVFTEPVEGEYRQSVFVPAGEEMIVPEGNPRLKTDTILPPECF